MARLVSVGWQANKKLRFTTEIWGQWDWDPASTMKQASWDKSVAYLVDNDVQIDDGTNFGLNKQTPDVEVCAGVSVRW